MKYLDKNGLSHLVEKVKEQGGSTSAHLLITEYRYITTEEGIFSFTIPNYNTTDVVEVYISGIKSIRNVDYVLSSSGVLTTLKSIDIGAELHFVINQGFVSDTSGTITTITDGVIQGLSDRISANQTAINGKAERNHTHDDRYYTESEVDDKLDEKADTDHDHDDRYYTENEIDAQLNTKMNNSRITISTTDPSGGSDGDIWIKYEE